MKSTICPGWKRRRPTMVDTPMRAAPRSLFAKIWSSHLIRDLGDGFGLIHIDRLMMNDISGVRGFSGIEKRGLSVRNRELCAAVVDHTNSTQPGRDANTTPQSREH